jgi:hypothetical protein
LLLRHLAAAVLPLASTVAGIVAVGIAVQLPSGPPAGVEVPRVQAPVGPGRPVAGTVVRSPHAVPSPRRRDLPDTARARPAVRLAPVLRQLPERGEPAAPSLPVPVEKPAVSEGSAPVAAAPAPAPPPPQAIPVPVVTPAPVAPPAPPPPPAPPTAEAASIPTLEITSMPSNKHAGHADPGKPDRAGHGPDDPAEGPRRGNDEAPVTQVQAPPATPAPSEPEAPSPPGTDSPGGPGPDKGPKDERAHERGHDSGGGKHGP